MRPVSFFRTVLLAAFLGLAVSCAPQGGGNADTRSSVQPGSVAESLPPDLAERETADPFMEEYARKLAKEGGTAGGTGAQRPVQGSRTLTPNVPADRSHDTVPNGQITFEKNRGTGLGRVVKIRRMQYARGEIDVLDLLKAEQELLDAKVNLIKAQTDQAHSAIRMERALGGGVHMQGGLKRLEPVNTDRFAYPVR